MEDRLTKIVKDSLVRHIDDIGSLAENMVSDLLAYGVIVSPAKVYKIVDKGTPFAIVMPKSVDSLRLYELKNLSKYGYYTSQEEAEQALKEG